MAKKKIYKHHQRTTIAAALTDAVPREIVAGSGSKEVAFVWADNSVSRLAGQVYNVRDYGAVGDGSTNDTVAVQACVTAAEATGYPVYFPQTSASYVLGRINIATGGIKIFGDRTKIKQVYDATTGSGGAGSTKVSPVFFCQKTASHVEITGFYFTTDDATFPSVPGWESYLAPICINRANYVNVHHNRFAGGQDRAIFLYGGNFCRVQNNDFIGTSMIMHIGIVANTNFWDGSIDDSTHYSPIAPIITDNNFYGYAKDNNCLFLSGATDFTVSRNKFLNFNHSSAMPVRLYVNDLGPTDIDGVETNILSGVFEDNTIKGTFETALGIFGQAQAAGYSLNTYMTRIKVANNTIEGTGIGIILERTYELRVLDNDVRTTDTPLCIRRELTDCKINDNYFECTTQSVVVPAIESTIVFNQNAVPNRTEFIGNTFVGPELDLYLFYTPPGVLLRDLTLCGNTFKYNSEVASNRLMQVSVTGVFDFSDNRFYIDSTAFQDRHICVINKTIGAWQDIQGYNPGYTVIPTVPNGFQYRVVSPVGDTGAVEPTWPTTVGDTVVDDEITWVCEPLRARVIANKNRVMYSSVRNRGFDIAADSVYFSDNIDFEQVALSGTDVVCERNRIESRSGSTTVNLIVENTTHAKVSGNYIRRPSTLNSVVLSMENVTNSKVTENYLAGDSNSPLGRAITSGRLEHFGNTFANAGTGGEGFSVVDAATARAMTQDSKGADVASANDLALGMNGTYFDITGATQINGIATAGWQDGNIITLQFDSTPTVKHNTAASAGYASLQLAGAVDFVASAGDTLTLRKEGSFWREIARTVI